MVAAVVTAYRRTELLQRLLASLASAPEVVRVFVVNNASEPISSVALAAFPSATVLQPGENLGTAGGLALGMQAALADARVQHVLICDDDAVVFPEAPARLVSALNHTEAGAVVPLVVRDNGSLGWFPGLLEPKKWQTIKREPLSAEEYLHSCGPAPVRFSWAPWPIMLIKRAAVEAVGYPRRDLWYHGADIEYSLRLSAAFPCYLVPEACCAHLPPARIAAPSAMHARECFGLQNQFYMCSRLAHCRRAIRHLPGNCWRTWSRARGGLSVGLDIMLAAWWGAIRGRPAMAPGFDLFFRRWQQSG